MISQLRGLLVGVRPEKPPALALGLVVFWVLLWNPIYGETVTKTLSLQPDALFRVDLNRLSFYPLVHSSGLSLILDIIAFYPLISTFERANGTVRTGVVLNVSCFLPAIVFCIVGTLLKLQVQADGASVWILAFSATLAMTSFRIAPTAGWPIKSAKLPAWAAPLLFLAVSLVWPGSTPLLSVLVLSFGYLLGLGKLNGLVEPPGKVILWIESRIAPVIHVLSYIVVWTLESDARELRAAQNEPAPVIPL